MVTPIQPVINDQFALQSPSQGLLSIVDQLDASWTMDTFDPLDGRPDDLPLRKILDEQFFSDVVSYLNGDPGIRVMSEHPSLAGSWGIFHLF
ncbi:hypothetical protein [Halovenus halobia]|uniref:hypothetical protein n=1 Tax=Halovenus halobia TaxID=3396622 RepID=UPI003F574C72